MVRNETRVATKAVVSHANQRAGPEDKDDLRRQITDDTEPVKQLMRFNLLDVAAASPRAKKGWSDRRWRSLLIADTVVRRFLLSFWLSSCPLSCPLSAEIRLFAAIAFLVSDSARLCRRTGR